MSSGIALARLMFVVLGLVFIATASLRARPQSDVLIMRNGDRLTCEIKRLERGVLYASFDYVDGTVSINWAKVARVESRQLFIVQAEDGSVYEGALRTEEAPGKAPVRIEVLHPAQPARVFEQGRVVELHQTAESFWKRVSGNFDSGLIYTKGNDTTQYNLGVGLRLRRERWNGEVGFNSTLSKTAGVSASTRNESWVQAERLVGRKRWFYAGAARFLESAQQGINLQTTLGGGAGRYVKDSNSARFSVLAGLAYQKTQYEPASGSQNPPNAMAGLFAGNLQLFRFKKTALELSASALPVLTEAGRVRTYVNSSYSIQIVANLWFKISFYGNWDNRPPATFSGSDYGTSSNVSWTFH
ncbi:MAG: DUF481 domain-containing protein [Bryobacteraceae bacterium]|nr:DUF481 domain-containing protein [Bryobacteraceae bacterium]